MKSQALVPDYGHRHQTGSHGCGRELNGSERNSILSLSFLSLGIPKMGRVYIIVYGRILNTQKLNLATLKRKPEP